MGVFTNIKNRIMRMASNDLGIDLGTANTLVYLKGKGIVINEPSIVALNQKTGAFVAVGTQAKDMLGRTPAHIAAIKPIVDGVISDYEVTAEMLSYLINKAQQKSPKMFGPRVVIGVPSGISSVEARAVRDAARSAGAHEVHIVEEPMAAAIGIELPVHDPSGSMVIDIGGGTTDVGVTALGGLVCSRNIRIAGDKFNTDIIAHLRNEYKLLIGEKTAEDIKLAIASVVPAQPPVEWNVRGRDLVTGLPREITITDADVHTALAHSMEELAEQIREVLESAPPEIVSDVLKRGIYLAGGGALIRGMDRFISESLGGMPVVIAADPLTAVVRGTASILDDIDHYRDSLLHADDELVPTE